MFASVSSLSLLGRPREQSQHVRGFFLLLFFFLFNVPCSVHLLLHLKRVYYHPVSEDLDYRNGINCWLSLSF